jgi:hypothetical protein
VRCSRSAAQWVCCEGECQLSAGGTLLNYVQSVVGQKSVTLLSRALPGEKGYARVVIAAETSLIRHSASRALVNYYVHQRHHQTRKLG